MNRKFSFSVFSSPRLVFLLLLLICAAQRSFADESDLEGVLSDILDSDESVLRPYERALRQLEEDELEVEMRRARKATQKGKKGKKGSKSKCKPCPKEGKVPKCEPKQKALHVYTNKECGCKGWRCIFIDCSHTKFDPKKPPKCGDCSKEPVKSDDCGCPVWKCEKRSCDKPENKAIKSCPSKCDRVVTEQDCGCAKYKCQADPPPEDECKKGCPKCQTCTTRPWRGAACQKKTGFVEKFCGPKTCPPAPTAASLKCRPCEEVKPRKDECGCVVLECKPKKSVDECAKAPGGKCPECTECVFKPFDVDKCPNSGTKKCQRMPCVTPTPPTCNSKCLKPVTKPGKCGCAEMTCEKPKDVKKCSEKSKCPKCTVCQERVICQDGPIVVKETACVRPPPKHFVPVTCGPCMHAEVKEDQCGDVTMQCVPNPTCAPAKMPTCKDKCHEPVEGKDQCGCPVFECKLMPKIPPTGPPKCQQECKKCQKCKRVMDNECGRIVDKCVFACDPYEPPEKPQCFEPMKIDECGCRVQPQKKPCVILPEGKCPNGTNPCPTSVLDACDCNHPRTCCRCPPVDPKKTCKQCEEVRERQNGDCVIQDCVPKKCPKPKKISCGLCHVKYMHTDSCHCCEEKCVKKICTPAFKPTCKEGNKPIEGKDACGCSEWICVPESSTTPSSRLTTPFFGSTLFSGQPNGGSTLSPGATTPGVPLPPGATTPGAPLPPGATTPGAPLPPGATTPGASPPPGATTPGASPPPGASTPGVSLPPVGTTAPPSPPEEKCKKDETCSKYKQIQQCVKCEKRTKKSKKNKKKNKKKNGQ